MSVVCGFSVFMILNYVLIFFGQYQRENFVLRGVAEPTQVVSGCLWF
jgi:hypothetical protein